MQSCLEIIPDPIQRVFVAYSGGLDSSVLLHLLMSAVRPFDVIPWHINHGIVNNAAQMQQFCTAQAQAYGLTLKLNQLELGTISSNLEAEARNRRYRLFEQQTQAGDCVVTAHHADDQAETFLLNALRGSGSAGLRGIARQRMLGDTLLLRPLLNYSRSRLESYATEQDLTWFDDPSNHDLRFDRNYLRHEVLPLVKQRWPGCEAALATSSALQAETQDLLDDLAAIDFAQLKRDEFCGSATLDVPGLLALTSGRRKNVIRYWIAIHELKVITQSRLQELLKQLTAKRDASPAITMPGYSIRRFDQRLFLVLDARIQVDVAHYDFGAEPEIKIPPLDLQLTRAAVFKQLNIVDKNQQLSISFRKSVANAVDRRRVKRLFQQQLVPPWARAAMPLVYLDGNLAGLLL